VKKSTTHHRAVHTSAMGNSLVRVCGSITLKPSCANQSSSGDNVVYCNAVWTRRFQRNMMPSALKMETACFCKTLVSTYGSTRRHDPEEHHHLHHRENWNLALSSSRVERDRKIAPYALIYACIGRTTNYQLLLNFTDILNTLSLQKDDACEH
jgi:hypothetical protein